jgi:hypothetical protein
MSNVKDMTGQRFGLLTVISFAYLKGKNKVAYWNCECDCGNTKSISGNSMRTGMTRSCGCLQKLRSTHANQKRGPMWAARKSKGVTK